MRSTLERVRQLEERLGGMELPSTAAAAATPLGALLDALLPDEELFEEQRAASAPSACSAAAAAALSAAILNDPDGEAAARAAAEADATPLCLLNPVQWVQYALFLERRVLGEGVGSERRAAPATDGVWCDLLLSHRAQIIKSDEL